MFNNYCEKDGIIHEITCLLVWMLRTIFGVKPYYMFVIDKIGSFIRKRVKLLMSCGKIILQTWNIRKCRSVVSKLYHPILRKKIGSKISDWIFIECTKSSIAYRFLVVKSDVLEYNIIIKTKMLNFLKIFFL